MVSKGTITVISNPLSLELVRVVCQIDRSVILIILLNYC
jgi:hypothetical protein